MDAMQIGAFVCLIQFYWNHSRLPDDSDMYRVARVDKKHWNAMKEKIIGRVIQEVADLEAEKAKAIDKSRKRRAAAKTRWGNANAFA